MITDHPISRRALLTTSGIAASALVVGCSDRREPLPGLDSTKKVLESPILTKKITAGDLPKLADRLPASPMVVQPIKKPGSFGGTLHRAQTEATDSGVIASFASSGLVEWSRDSSKAIPSLAETYQRSDDNTIFTFTLRQGLKWSDGKPFTADDVIFAIKDWLGNATLVPALPVWFADVDQQLPKVSKTDENTVRIEFREPFALFEKYLCHPSINIQIIKPKHYLEKYHPAYTDKAKVTAAAKKAGFDSWDQYFADRDNPWTNPDRPVMGAYQVAKAAGAQSGTASLERNPFYYKTDPDGRQLPYIDKIQVQVLDQAALDLRAANGDLEFQGNFLGYNSTQVYLRNAKAKGFTVQRWQAVGTLLSLCPNLSHNDRVWRSLFMTKDFRLALSHAINRKEINDTLLGGLGIIRQPMSTDGSPYGIAGGGRTAVDYDVEKAGQLLDGIGAKKRGSVRYYRGKPLEFTVIYTDNDQGIARADAFNLVKKDWAAVGVKMNVRPVDDTLYAQLRASNDFDFDGTTMIEDDWDLEPVWYVPTSSGSHSCPGYGLWYATGGKDGVTPPAEIKKLMDTWDELRTAQTDQIRIAAGKKITQQHNDNVYVIGLMKLPFQPVVVSNKIIGVRTDKPQLSFYYGREGITKPEQISLA
ncbi:ABC transporter substrate-binding protein [Microlunatus soli]|uniref:Peptide/nickel transport system substrate-binding protein n=1 Tax=Microlunatus soli TaxID=630515 RepID=A0A1H1ZYV7_9ACTN|nr:ABC transporter substrate-binding protein [Microlunatus soli]SDT38894.1 peptide/nickel transport system substrate-binding protein [Microlunatus soli]